jgi:hypothetical protein
MPITPQNYRLVTAESKALRTHDLVDINPTDLTPGGEGDGSRVIEP